MTRRSSSLVAVALLVLVINLPLVHGTWTRWQVERSGEDVTAAVVGHRTAGEGSSAEHWVSFRFPEEVDPDGETWQAEVDEAAYDEAVAAGEISVRVLPDDPAAHQVDGAVRGYAGLVVTLVADAFLLVLVLLLWRYRGRRRPTLKAVAMGDVERCPPGVLLERISGELYLIRGEVAEIHEGRIVLDLGGRSVVVILDGHQNPVGYQQPAQVRARMVG